MRYFFLILANTFSLVDDDWSKLSCPTFKLYIFLDIHGDIRIFKCNLVQTSNLELYFDIDFDPKFIYKISKQNPSRIVQSF